MNILLQALENDWTAIKAWLASSETWLISLIKAEWALDRQLAIKDLSADLAVLGSNLQSSAPGISGKQLGMAFLAAVEGQLAAQSAEMLYQDVLLAISMATQKLNPPATPGNAGILPGGIQSGG